MDINQERDTASKMVVSFQKRFQYLGQDSFPLLIAKRWHQAVHAEPIDLKAMKEIFDEADPKKNSFEIAFFGFCNHMQRVVHDGLQESFERRA